MRPPAFGLAFRPSTRIASSRVILRCPSHVPRRYVSSQKPQQPYRSVAQLLQWKPQEEIEDVVVNGFVRSVRGLKAHRFVSLGDGSSLAPLQAVVETDRAEGCVRMITTICLSRLSNLLIPIICSLAVGAAVRLTGSWVSSPGAAQSHELHVKKVDILGPSDAKVDATALSLACSRLLGF